MLNEQRYIEGLTTLNRIAETLNQRADLRTALNRALHELVTLVGLETGWLFLKDPTSQNQWGGRGYVLVAHHNLPPALAPGQAKAWRGGCACQTLCNQNQLDAAYVEVQCSRLAGASGNRRGLVVHASTPLRSGREILGIMNLAAPTWQTFTPEALAFIAHVGSLMGIALDRANLYDLLQEQRIHEHAALLDFSNQLLSRYEFDDLMTYLTEEMRRMLEADACALLLPSRASGMLVYRAASGWHDDPVAHQRQVPADETSTPGWVMRHQQPMVVADLQTNDPTTWNSAWLNAEGFRGHAVVPLIAVGRSIGALIINTRTPRHFTEDELRFTRLMANQAALALEKGRLHQEEIERQRMAEELTIGSQIQQSMLPDSAPTLPGWAFAAIYLPARIVGGDFFDFFELPRKPKRLGIVIADVAGKGVPAALFMALSRSMIRTKALSGGSPMTALKRANRLISKDSRSKLFLTAFYALLEIETGQLTYTRAGHNLPLWVRPTADGGCTVEVLDAPGMLLGVFEEVTLEERTIQLQVGDMLVLYTDGVTEAMNEVNEMFGEQRLRDVVQNNAHLNPQALLNSIIHSVNQFIGEAPQTDDFTLVVVKRVGL